MINCTLARELLARHTTLTSDATELYTVIPPFPDLRGFQGGCSDGTRYYYNISMHYDLPTQEHTYSRIAKIDLHTREIVRWSENMSLDHANDATYYAPAHEIMVCHNKPNYHRVTVLDADTLIPKRTVELPFPIYSIDYNAARDAFVVGVAKTWDFRVLNADFSPADDVVRHCSPLTQNYVKQGLCADDEQVYFILWDGKRKRDPDFQNAISVYGWNGDFRGLIEFDVGVKEPESLSIVDGEIVAVCGISEPILYRITPKEKA